MSKQHKTENCACVSLDLDVLPEESNNLYVILLSMLPQDMKGAESSEDSVLKNRYELWEKAMNYSFAHELKKNIRGDLDVVRQEVMELENNIHELPNIIKQLDAIEKPIKVHVLSTKRKLEKWIYAIFKSNVNLKIVYDC